MITCSKSQLALMYQISPGKLRTLMNDTFFTELEAVGYHKRAILLSPLVIEKFTECFGEPIDHLNKKQA